MIVASSTLYSESLFREKKCIECSGKENWIPHFDDVKGGKAGEKRKLVTKFACFWLWCVVISSKAKISLVTVSPMDWIAIIRSRYDQTLKVARQALNTWGATFCRGGETERDVGEAELLSTQDHVSLSLAFKKMGRDWESAPGPWDESQANHLIR